MRDLKSFCRHLKDVGFEPATVIDVGVAWGTPALYNAFPEAYFILIEALSDFEPQLKNILRQHRGEYHLLAVSDRAGQQAITFADSHIGRAGASLFGFKNDKRPSRPVVVETLDRLLAGRPLAAPLLIKTDAQRADLAVVMGGTAVVQQADVVIMETALFEGDRLHLGHGLNMAADVIAYMNGIGFRLYDFVGFTYRPHDNALGQVDIAFAKRDGMLRRYSGW